MKKDQIDLFGSDLPETSTTSPSKNPQISAEATEYANSLFSRSTTCENLPSIKTINLGTGFGKTYLSHISAANRLIEAKKTNSSLIVIYSAPMNSQIEIESDASTVLDSHNIPALIYRSDNELTKSDSPYGLYPVLKRMAATRNGSVIHEMAKLSNRFKGLSSKRKPEIASEAFLTGMDSDEIVQGQKETSLSQSFSVIKKSMSSIAAMSGKSQAHMLLDEKELKKKISQANGSLLDATRSLVQYMLKYGIKIDTNTNDFKELSDRLCPWHQVQSAGIGLLSMTTAKMMTLQHVTAINQKSPSSYVIQKKPLRDIIHNGKGLLNIENSQYVFLIDESDSAKETIESTLSGSLINRSHITQAVGALHREISRFVYSDGDDFIEVKNCVDRGDEIASPELIEQFFNLRDRRDNIYHQMERYRQIASHPLSRTDISDIISKLQNILYIAANRNDPAIMRLSSAGLFTNGPVGFLNADKIDQFQVSQHTTREILIEGKDRDPLGSFSGITYGFNKLPLRDWFEAICEALMITKAIAEPGYSKIRQPISSQLIEEDMHTAPLKGILRKLSYQKTQELFEIRQHYSPQSPLDIKFAFQSPHIIYSFRRSIEEERSHDINNDDYVSITPEVTYRLCSAEFFLEQLISSKAYWDFKDLPSSDTSDDNGKKNHELYLISATGGYEKNHIGGFSLNYFDRSAYVAHEKMSSNDFAIAQVIKNANEKNRDITIFPLKSKQQHSSRLLRVIEKILNSKSNSPDIAKLKSTLAMNRFKYQELKRAMLFVDALCTERDITIDGDLDTDSAMKEALSKKIDCSLLITQTLGNIRMAMQLLCDHATKNQRHSFVHELESGLIYRVSSKNKQKSVLVVFYDKDTDKRLKMLSREKAKSLYEVLGIKMGKGELPSMETVLTKKANCKIIIMSAWKSASRGVNFVCDKSADRSDLDALMISMPSYYSNVFSKPDYKNSSKSLNYAISQSHSVFEHVSLNDVEVRYLNELSINAAQTFKGAKSFLDEQHKLLLAVDCVQCLGRAERGSPESPRDQYIFIADESLVNLTDGYHVMYQDQPDLLKTLSVINTKALEKAFDELERNIPDPHNYFELEDQQDEAIACFSHEKNEMLDSIEAVRSGQIVGEEATSTIEKWNAWHSPLCLFDPDKYTSNLIASGWSDEFASSLWVKPPENGGYYVLDDTKADGGHARLIFNKIEVTAKIKISPIKDHIPHKFLKGFKLPECFLGSVSQIMPDTSIHGLSKQSTRGIPRPHVLPDYTGVWGELVCHAWFETVMGWLPMDDKRVIPLFELYDMFYEVETEDKKVLVAVDAKYWTEQTDIHYGNVPKEKVEGKYQAAKRWSQDNGYDNILVIYFNGRPQPAEKCFVNEASYNSNVISFSGIYRSLPTDIAIPHGVTWSDVGREDSVVDQSVFIYEPAMVAIRRRLANV